MAVLLPHENILIGLNVKKKPKNNLANNSELGRMFLLFWAFCEAQGKERAKGRPRKVTKRSFIDGGWWISFP